MLEYRSIHTSFRLPSWLGRDRKGEKEKEIGPYRYFFPLTLSPGSRYGLVVVVPGGMSEGGGLCLIHTGS